jgi:hypothetical protein
MAISRIRPVIRERAVLRYCGKFTLATLSVMIIMMGLIRDIAIFIILKILRFLFSRQEKVVGTVGGTEEEIARWSAKYSSTVDEHWE